MFTKSGSQRCINLSDNDICKSELTMFERLMSSLSNVKCEEINTSFYTETGSAKNTSMVGVNFNNIKFYLWR